ncbi:MarR family transcriptional regulator [Agromyces sp. H66]|uniref:MarR family winged helix-turn-helix transcriptional regulator n=1 Tax=Agromyces sp. H66 TaxID=2529859 RepID=UPI0010AB029F|nr:MarR family transcriptional regulator [Agromyces sp. H66]
MKRRRLSTEFDDASASPGLLLWRVTNAWQSAQRHALAPFELTHVQFVLLASLTWLEADEPVTQADLAEHAGTDRMMTSQVLRTLEEKGLVVRAPHPRDARARALSATDAGADLANRANAAVEATDRAFFGRLGDDAGAFSDALRRLDGRT